MVKLPSALLAGDKDDASDDDNDEDRLDDESRRLGSSRKSLHNW
jgi:hypothetical protein